MKRKITVFLLEDDEADIQNFKQSLPSDHFELAGVARNYNAALTVLHTLDFDLLVIDIYLNGTRDGIRLANYVNDASLNIPFIFLTGSMEQHIFEEAKRTRPYSYLIKPFNKLELQYAMEMAIEKFADRKGAFMKEEPVYLNGGFYVKHRDSLVKIVPDAIAYIEVEGQYCKIMTDKGAFLVHMSLQQFQQELSRNKFIRSHRNYLVNIKRIERVFPNDNMLILEDGQKILLSRKYKTEFLRRFRILK
ncbi:MAG: response regulator transcription factor [Bacteroidota bacterium]